MLHAFHRDNCTILHTDKVILHTDNVRVTNSRIYKALSTLTGDYSRRIRRQSPFSETVTEFGDCCRIRRQNVAVSGDYSLQCGQGLNTFLAVNAKYR